MSKFAHDHSYLAHNSSFDAGVASKMSFCRNTCSVLIVLLAYNYVNLSDLNRQERGATQPCLACTVVNKVQCCQKYNKCCNNQAPTNANSRVVQSPNRPPPLQRVKVRYRPVGGQNGRVRVTCPANRDVYGMLKKRDCTPCNPDGSCPSPNTRCCPPTTRCCRRLDFQNFCPLTEISARCCRRCMSDNSCRAGEGCCAQPGQQGCCLTSCGANSRNCPSRNSGASNVAPTSDRSTIDRPTNVGGSTRPPDRVTALTINRDGSETVLVVTITVDGNGNTQTVQLQSDGGYIVLTDIVEVTHTKTDVVEETVTQTNTVDVTLLETEIDGVTYTATPIGNGAYTLTKTTVINGKQSTFVATVYDSSGVVGNGATVTQSLISDSDVGNNQLQPSFSSKFY